MVDQIKIVLNHDSNSKNFKVGFAKSGHLCCNFTLMLPVRTKNPLENVGFLCWVEKHEGLVFRMAQLGRNVSVAITPNAEVILY